MASRTTSQALTLPDLLRDSLDVVFVGINPSIFSAERGHYFARASNRFWPCFSRSVLSRNAREALSVASLQAVHDRFLLDYGIGFTDVVKRATPKASDLRSSELAAGVEHLVAKLARYRPKIACFHGVTGYRPVARIIAARETTVHLGLQEPTLGSTRLYVVPNPSGANAHFTRADQTDWYDRLAALLAVSKAQPQCL